jgi:hypothetical protein
MIHVDKTNFQLSGTNNDGDVKHTVKTKFDDNCYDMTMNAAVKAFQEELDIDNGEFLRER